ncbi:MAG: hypothetical protein ACM3PY_11065 [Omnitrophica WOR_2 bacterium]
MITPNKIEEWIQEIEERSSSAPTIVRYIANRLSDLTKRNEELLAENIELRTGKKVEEYESRIANLEYQVDLLKRQLGGEAISQAADTTSLFVFNTLGQVIRVELNGTGLASGKTIAEFNHNPGSGTAIPHILATSSQEEILFVFDSGRTTTKAVSDIPALENGDLGWEKAILVEPLGNEELAMLTPVAKMSLFEFGVQVSRRGYLKKIKQDYFQAHVANAYIGTGAKLSSDKTCSLSLCNHDDLLVLVTREGFAWSMEVNRLPLTIEEALRLSPTDHIVTAFIMDLNSSLLMVTENGKIIQRDSTWLEPVNSFKSRGQPAFSKEKRDAGIRIAGAESVKAEDWILVLRSDGRVLAYQVNDLFSAGTILSEQPETQIFAIAKCRFQVS